MLTTTTTQTLSTFLTVARRVALPTLAVALLVLQGCCCSKYGGYSGGCNSCGSCGGGGGVYDYGAGYGAGAVAPAPGGCPDGNCGVYPSAFNTGTTMQAGLPPATMTATAPIYAPAYQTVPMTATLQPVAPTH